MNNSMEVIKRSGSTEPIFFDKITVRIKKLCSEEELKILDIPMVVQKTISNIYNEIKTSELDILSANICASLITLHPLYGNLAAKISISNLHKETDDNFFNTISKLYNNESSLVTKEIYNIVKNNKGNLESIINYQNDYNYTFFGLKTLERSYLLKINNIIIERPQHMLLRVSLGIHKDDISKVIETYNNMSMGKFIHASPTLFNSGTKFNQLSSCFLLGTDDDMESIYKTILNCAKISKTAGGIGVHISNIRSKGSLIKGTNGKSDGIIPMLKVYNATAKYVNQGGRRPGSIAVYLEPWHADIFDFIELRKNTGNEEDKTRDLFLALWIPDNFMNAVQNNEKWYLMCPNESPFLNETYGEKYEELYNGYVKTKRYKKEVNARDLWNKILESQIETGMPYIGFKDNVNNKTNQQNIGIIKSSNLCIEICEYSDDKETAVCNLASIAVNKYIKEKEFEKDFTVYSKDNCEYCVLAKMLLKKNNYKENILDNKKDRINLYRSIDLNEDKVVNTMPQIYYGEQYIGGYTELEEFIKPEYDFNELKKISKIICCNLNKIIDINYYPTSESELSNFKHRPIGIGIQGLADIYIKMRYPYDSEEAFTLNKKIMETIYYGALEQSMELAKEREEKINEYLLIQNKVESKLKKEILEKELSYKINNSTELFEKDIIRENYKGSYSTFEGSPFSKGILQFDMWNIKPSDMWDWDELKENIKKYGTRNSLLTALMPTASTSQILGNNECFEPYTNNIYTRKTQAGEYYIINRELILDLINCNLWNEEIKNTIIKNSGSIQNIQNIPDKLKKLYRVVWEIPQKAIVQQAIDRGPFIDQSQSMNLYMAKPNITRLQSSHFYAWKNGLKTGIYYLHSKPAVNAIQFTVDNNKVCESCSG